MKRFRNFKLFKRKYKNKSIPQQPIYVPIAVLNDTDKEPSRVLNTKQFKQPQKLRHPSGTTMIRLDRYQELIDKAHQDKSENKDVKLKSYQAPTKKIYTRTQKIKPPWRY